MSHPLPSKVHGRCLYAISRHTNPTLPHPRHAFTRRIHATPLSQAPKMSSAQLRSSIKNSQMERQQVQQQVLMEKYKDDPAGAARYMERMNKQAMRAGQDMWANAKIPALDVVLPKEDAGIWDRLKEIKTIFDPQNSSGRIQNWVKCVGSMYHMAQESAFPAQYSYPAHPYTTPSELSSETLPPPSTCPSYKKPSAYNPQTYIQCLRYDSDSKRFPPWSSGIKGIGMSLYLKMCEAVGKGDVEVLKTVCSDERLAELLKIIEKRNPKTIYDWRVDSVEPCKIVSLRASHAYASSSLPKGRNRLLVNALIKFDTTQSAQLVTAGNLTSWNSKRVVEYMIIEKRGWTSSPWTIREKRTSSD